MLTSARRREQRARFGALLTAVRAPKDNAARCKEVDDFEEARVNAAGAFGILEPDLTCLLFGRVLAAGREKHTNCHGNGDRTSTTPHCQNVAAARNVHHLAQTCKYLSACFGLHGSVIRLEAAATACTSLSPTKNNTGSHHHQLVETPALDQFMQEERSRFDVQMLESALVSMVTHCTAEHCRAVRRAHNLRIATQVLCRLEQDVLLGHILGQRRPCVKVVHTTHNCVWTGVEGLNARIGHYDCIVATSEGNNVDITCLRNETPLGLRPSTELCSVWKRSIPAPPAMPAPWRNPLPKEWRVRSLALSDCGKWVALVRTHSRSEEETATEYVVGIWEVDGPTAPYACLRLRQSGVQCVWFRQVDVGAKDAADGVLHPGATVLCFCATTPYRNGVPSWRPQLDHWFAGARCIGTSKVYQYCMDDGALRNHQGELPDWHGLVIKPSGTQVETMCLDDEWVPDKDRSTLVATSIHDETSLVSVSIPTECPHSFGACLFGMAEVGIQVGAYRQLAVSQCVVLDLSYKHRNGDSSMLLRPALPMHSVAGHRPPQQQFVQLSPRGDLAVVLVHREKIEGSWMENAPGYALHIMGRRGTETLFTPLARLDINRCVHNFRTQRALAAALATPSKRPRPDGCIRVRSPPTSRAFSPCGRFLLLGFSEGIKFTGSEHSWMHVDAPLHADGGMCIIDMSDIWEVPTAGDAAMAWIECKADVVPLRMRWSMAGLWLTTRRGPLLLGTTATDPRVPRA